jgi:hypothetical protein
MRRNCCPTQSGRTRGTDAIRFDAEAVGSSARIAVNRTPPAVNQRRRKHCVLGGYSRVRSRGTLRVLEGCALGYT